MKKLLLLILDGWGKSTEPAVSAIKQANTPFVDSLYHSQPNAELVTFGEEVGLPAGQMGNSEVGHLNIGAGRIVYQELLNINLALQDGRLANNKVLLDTIDYAKAHPEKKIHLMGLVSDGGVHAHVEHLIGMVKILAAHELQNIYIHVFTDGRDTDPFSGKGFVQLLEEAIQDTPAKIASLVGRYYAMDRDLRWERTKKAYDMLVSGKGLATQNISEALAQSYANGITDEFVKPIVATDANQQALATLQEGDVVLFVNFRTDRGRQLTRALTQEAFPDYGMQPLPLRFVTMTRYDDDFKDIPVLFKKDNIINTLGEVLEQQHKRQLRMAETEKYPHVTFFFSGGREQEFVGEERFIIPSPKVATYDLQPEMSAEPLTQLLIDKLKAAEADLIVVNYANADMVGHTGVFSAAVKAVEKVDSCVERVVAAAQASDYHIIIIADHGNADKMINPDGSVNTAHTTNLVPIFYLPAPADINIEVSPKEQFSIKDGKLADIAPTILHIMDLPIPDDMTGNVLLSKI